MAGKVNTKFVTILVVICALLAGGAASFYWLVVVKDTSELEAIGDRHLVQATSVKIDPQASPEARAEAQQRRRQDYRLAVQSYGKAWNRDPRNVDVLLKYIDAYSNMPVKDEHEAKDVLGHIYGFTREATELRDDDQLLEDYYQLLYRWARQFSAVSFYRDIYSLTSTRLDTDPNNLPSLKFRGIAQAVQISDDMDRSDQQLIRSDLETVRAARPKDTDVLHYLARLDVYEAGRSERAELNSPNIEPARVRALELAEKALAIAPDNVQVKVEYLDTLSAVANSYQRSTLFAGRTEQQIADLESKRERTLDTARPVLRTLEAELLKNPGPPLIVQRVAEMLPRFDKKKDPGANPGTVAGLERTENLLRVATEARPDMLLYKLMYANVLKLQLQLDPAYDAYIAARDHDIRGNYEASLRDQILRQQAMYEVANIELIRAENAKDPATRKKLLEAVDQSTQALRAVVDEDKRVLMLLGKVALIRGQNSKAMLAIDKASELAGDNDVEALLLSARARQAEKQWGAASARLERVLAIVANSPRQDIQINIRLQLAEMFIRSRRMPEARFQLDTVLEEMPGDPVAMRLLALWHTNQEDYAQAIEVLEAAGVSDQPAVVSQLADLYQSNGQPHRSREILAAKLQETPSDLRLLQKLLKLLDDTDQKNALIDRAVNAGGEPRAIELLRLQIDSADENAPRLTLDDMIERITDTNTSAFEQSVRKAQLYFQYRQIDKAREAYKAAKAINPKDDRLLVLALDLAIIDKDFPTARRIAADAGRRDLDLADGHFIRGKLAAAEGNLRQALVSYKQGLKQRPIFADGWRQYGDLLVQIKDYEEALTAYDTALSQKPDSISALTGIANAQRFLGRHPQALASLRIAVKYAPNNQTLATQYLSYEERFGDADTVRALRRELVERQPENSKNRASLAVLTAQSGDVSEAFKILDAMKNDLGASRELVAARAGVTQIAGDGPAGLKLISDYLDAQGDQVGSLDYILLARYNLTLKSIDESLAAYRKAIELEPPDNRTASREYGDILFNFGRLAQAAEVYQDLFDSPSPSNRDTLGARLAEALLRTSKPDRAEAVLNKIKQNEITDSLRAILASQRGKPAEALDYLNRSLSKNSRNAMPYLQRAEIYAAQPGNQQKALDDVRQALSINPDLLPALLLQSRLQVGFGQLSDAARTLRSFLDKAPNNTAARFELARIYLRVKDLGAAEALVNESLKLAPDNARWLQLSANIAVTRGDTASAIASYEKLIKASPSPQILGQLASLYLDGGKPTAASSLLSEHATLLNASAALQSLRGRALVSLRKNDQAARVFTLALQRCQSQSQVNDVIQQMVIALDGKAAAKLAEQVQQVKNPQWVGFALIQMSITQRDYDEALARLSQMRRTVPQTDTATRVRIEGLEALCMMQNKDYQGARDAYQRLLKAAPNNVEVLNNLAYLLSANLDDPESALPLAKRAAELAPKSAEVLDTLGWTYYQTNDYEKARKTLEASVNIRPLPANTLHLGRVYLAIEDRRRAEPMLEQAVKLAEAAQSLELLEDARYYLKQARR